MILKFNVKEQTISLVNTKSVPRIGSKDYLVLQFSFSSDWENLDKLVYLQSGDVSQPINIVDNLVEVPEWFTEQNSFNVTLFGTDGTTEVPTNVVSVQLEKSNDLWVKDAPEPQPSWLVSVLDAAELVKEATVHGPTIGSNGNWYTWDFESKQYIDTGVGASGGSGDHSKLTNRDANDQHPMSAITGLAGALGGKMDSNNPVGSGSFSLNRDTNSTIGDYSVAEGNRTKASGDASHAEGRETTAPGDFSHAEGYITTASGDASHAEGLNTTASSDFSHAEGHSTKASGSVSHAEGLYTTASGQYSHVQGKYNIEDSSHLYAHIVGNGIRDTARSNAHTIDWSGNAWFAGDVFVGSTSGTNKDDGSKKLATEEYINNEIADCIKAPATASVGQTIIVKAVDETGKPTEWEAADMSSGGGDVWEFGGTIPLDLITPTARYEFAPCSIWKKVRIVRVRQSYNSALSSNVWYGASNCENSEGKINEIHSLYTNNGYIYNYVEMMADDEGGVIGIKAESNNTNSSSALNISAYSNNRVISNIPVTYAALNVTEDSNWFIQAVNPSTAWDGSETYYWWGVRA